MLLLKKKEKLDGKEEKEGQRQEEGLLLDCLNSLMGFYV